MLYTPSSTDVEKMNRTDLVFELAKHVPIDRYHSVLKYQTEHLRALLRFYTRVDIERFSIHDPRRMFRKVVARVAMIENQLVTEDMIDRASDMADSTAYMMAMMFGDKCFNKRTDFYNTYRVQS